MQPALIIVKTGSTFTAIRQQHGDFEHWIAEAVAHAAPQLPLRVLDVTGEPELPALDKIAGIIITGSNAMVSERAAWSQRLVPWLQLLHRAGKPMLGICFGHQLLAHALGGRVDYHPQGIEIGSHTIELNEQAQSDPLFKSLPASFPAQLVHRQSALALPPQAVVLASSAHEAHQAFRLQNTWGVQFHPEFSSAAMAAYVHCMQQDLQADNIDCQRLLEKIEETPASASLLARFAALVSGSL